MYYFEDQNVDLVGENLSRVEESYTHARGEDDTKLGEWFGIGCVGS